MRAKAETTAWARRYRTALSQFLRQASATHQASAERLGCQAASLGLETLSVAGIHDQALQRVAPPEDTPGNARQEMIERAETFFKETIVPIEATHPAARKTEARINQLRHALRRSTGKLSTSSARLKQATARREAAETRTANRKGHHDSLLAEAQRMQKRLRHRMHGIISQQESGRKRIGDELRNELAQALLAIDISLLALNSSGLVPIDEIEKNIADAQRIVLKCELISVDRQDSL